MAQATKTKKPAGSRAKQGPRKASKDVATPIDATANAALAGKAAVAGTRAAGRALSLAASRAKAPLIVGGSAAAGLAGGLAVIHRRKGRKRTWNKR